MGEGAKVAGGCALTAVLVVAGLGAKLAGFMAIVATVMRVFDFYPPGARMMWPLWGIAAGCTVVALIAFGWIAVISGANTRRWP